MNRSEQLLQQAYDILDQAAAEYDPSHVVALISGGHDSVVSTHVTMSWAVARGHIDGTFVASIDTRTGIPENEAYTQRLCAEQGWRRHLYHTPSRYEALILERGFPGSPMHGKMYDRLKGRCIEQLLRDYAQYVLIPGGYTKSGKPAKPKRRRRPMMLVTGVRQSESAIRMGYKSPTDKRDAAVWVNAIFYWTATDCADYIEQHGIERNPVVDTLHRSGDCQCGANAHPGEIDELEFWYPNDVSWIRRLERVVQQKGFTWDWNSNGPPDWWGDVKDGQEFLSPDLMMLCVACQARGDGTALSAENVDMEKLRELMAHEGEWAIPKHFAELTEFSARYLAGPTLSYLHLEELQVAANLLAQSPLTEDYCFYRTFQGGTVWSSPREDYMAWVHAEYDCGDIVGMSVEMVVANHGQLPLTDFRPLQQEGTLVNPRVTWQHPWGTQVLRYSYRPELVAGFVAKAQAFYDANPHTNHDLRDLDYLNEILSKPWEGYQERIV